MIYEIDSKYQRFMIESDINGVDEESTSFDEDKAIAITKTIKNIEAECEILDKTIKELKGRLDVKKRGIESRKDYLMYMFMSHQKEKLKTPLFDISLRQNPCKLNITDKTIIPEQYKTYETVEKIDTDTIKRNLKAGEVINGAELIKDMSIKIYTSQSKGEQDENGR